MKKAYIEQLCTAMQVAEECRKAGAPEVEIFLVSCIKYSQQYLSLPLYNRY